MSADREELYVGLTEARLLAQADGDRPTARFLRSLVVARQVVGKVPTVEEYHDAYREPQATPQAIAGVTVAIKHFGS